MRIMNMKIALFITIHDDDDDDDVDDDGVMTMMMMMPTMINGNMSLPSK